MPKNRLAASADASFELVSSQSTARSGNGTKNSKKATGNAAAFIHVFPRKRKAPVQTRQTNASVTQAKWSLRLKFTAFGFHTSTTIKAAAPSTNGGTAQMTA